MDARFKLGAGGADGVGRHSVRHMRGSSRNLTHNAPAAAALALAAVAFAALRRGSEERIAAEALRKADQRYRDLVDAAREGV
jgi:hypothetical protein